MGQIPGAKIGHAQDLDGGTGCTVVLTPEGAVCGVDQRGGAPGTRETDLLRPMHLVERVHAVVLSGGSAFGLSAADGVMRWLDERGYGFDAGVARVPIAPAASLFDLAFGQPDVRPDGKMGYSACASAVPEWDALNGNVGAGTGATVGHLMGNSGCMKGGLGTSILEVRPGIFVGAAIAVNCFGDVVDPSSGETVAGSRRMPEGGFVNPLEVLSSMPETFDSAVKNTIIGVIATNAAMSKTEANKVAQMAHNGLARTVIPAHTMLDGDTLFALSTCREERVGVNTLGAFSCEVVSRAVLRAVTEADSLCGIPSASSLA